MRDKRPQFLSSVNYEEELKLIEKAKLPLSSLEARGEPGKILVDTDEQIQQLIQDILLASVVELEDCCNDCILKYNDLNNLINTNAIEFSEFVSSPADLNTSS